MTRTSKKQVAFYADIDVFQYLQTLPQMQRTSTINRALRLMAGLPDPRGERFAPTERLAERIDRLEATITAIIKNARL